jgi:hypothetical protein
MKRYYIIIILTLLFSTACEDDFYGLNEDIKNPPEVPGESLFTSAQKSMVDQMVSTNVNYNPTRFLSQYWTSTTYTDEPNYDFVTRNIPEQHWSELYRKTLKNLDEATKVLAQTEVPPVEVAAHQNKIQIAEIHKVYAFSVLVETFGDIPYSEALDIDILLPGFDDGLTIYQDLITRLDAAVNALDDKVGSYDNGENIYFGDVAAWKRFANSLKLRMGLTLADMPSMAQYAQATVESAVAAGVFTSNADNATMNYLTSPPNTNPLYIDLVASGRKDFVAANTIVDAMNALDDPRRKYYFEDNLDDPATPEVEYVGGIYGANNSYNLYTHISETIQQPDFGGTILDYAEVEFMLAEAVERGYNVGGTAEEHYNNAIKASFEFWGGTEAEADAYLQQPNVSYTTAPGSWKEKVGTQMWIALYNRGYAGWHTIRRLDQPSLNTPPQAVSGFPVRYTYPIVEQTLNGANWQAASAAIGGDVVTTKLFFDVN